MPVSWKKYLDLPNADRQFCECCRQCGTAFDKQREHIRRLVRATSPAVVACLGAGVLNDIPYAELVRSGATLHLVDWLPGTSQAGVRLSIVDVDEGEHPSCQYCHPAVGCPEKYCAHYRRSGKTPEKVCDAFLLSPGPPAECAAFAEGEYPVIHCADVTAGFASEFGRRIPNELRGARSWRQAFSKATRLADKLRNHRTQLPIADSSVDLVTSSMVVSQFVHEPYDFFSHRAAEMLGAPSADEDRKLAPALNRLTSTLLSNQMKGHCDEIDRMLAPGGLCYFSFELFHAIPSSQTWHLVDGMANVLEIIGHHFFFNFDMIAEHESVARFQSDRSPSLVVSLVVQAKT